MAENAALNEETLVRLRHMKPVYRRLLTIIADKIELGDRPSRREINVDAAYAFPSAVTTVVKGLEKMGALSRDDRSKRNIGITREGWACLHRAAPFGGMPQLDWVPAVGMLAGEIPAACVTRCSHIGYVRGHVVTVIDRAMSLNVPNSRPGELLVVMLMQATDLRLPTLAVRDGRLLPIFDHIVSGKTHVIGQIVGRYQPFRLDLPMSRMR